MVYYITAFYQQVGVPKTGLTPTITIRRVDTSAIVVSTTMAEMGGGWYKYDFATFDPHMDYVWTCDGGITLVDSDRYKYGNSDLLDYIFEIVKRLKK